MSTALSAKGGYIDTNNNHEIDDNDTALPDTFVLKTTPGAKIISPITDLLANGADADKLAEILNISKEDLYADPYATNNVALAKAFQIVYAVKADGKEADFVKEINAYTPAAEANTTTTTSTEATSNENTTVLPVIKADSTDANVTATASSANIDELAKLALNVVSSDNAKAIINDMLNCTATDAAMVEEKIANIKDTLAESMPKTQTTATADTQTTATATTEANATDTTATAATTDTNTTTATDNTATTNTTEESSNTTVLPSI
jgi:hypothetical protein